MTLTCEDLLTYLSDYLDGALPAELTAVAEEHLATCPNCRIVLDSTQQTLALYHQQYRRTIPLDTRRHLHAQLITTLREKAEK